MQIIESSQNIKTQTSIQLKRLLIVGPKLPIGSAQLTMQVLLEDLTLFPSVQVRVISTSPSPNARKKMTGLNLGEVKRLLLVLSNYIYEIPRCDTVLVFSNNLCPFILAPFLLLIARILNKSFYLNLIDKDLDLFINTRKNFFREYLLYVLRSTDGIITHANPLKDDLNKLGCTNVYYLPGCGPLPEITLIPKQCSSEIRVLFLGHSTRFKYPLTLLDALKIVSEMSDEQVSCDFYGPIDDLIHDEFLNGIKYVPNARYCGKTEEEVDFQLISQYDVIVLPAYYDTEGYPGVLIETMQAGVPVITPKKHTFPELITNGINGFVVPPEDSYFLAMAIITLAVDSNMRKRMGEANHLKGQEIRAEKFVGQLLKIIFPGLIPVRQGK